jgi:hypothetical protein
VAYRLGERGGASSVLSERAGQAWTSSSRPYVAMALVCQVLSPSHSRRPDIEAIDQEIASYPGGVFITFGHIIHSDPEHLSLMICVVKTIERRSNIPQQQYNVMSSKTVS